MTENFENLSDYDFERLVADLLTAEWNVHVESFPRGRDGGVDLRVLGPAERPLYLAPGDEVVVQCKHRPTAAFKDVKSELTKEAKKGIAGAASRYILVTSARLTRANKKSIEAIFGNRISEVDILGRDDIAALIRRHPDVEKATPKLWMSSGAVLSVLVHHLEHLRSVYLREELRRLQRSFIETKFVAKAMESIDEHGICILAGPPGVGKTTTAHIVLLRFMADGWQPVTAVGDVRELEAQIDPNMRQILFFDDFLGQTSLEEKVRTGGDGELLRLIRHVESDPTKVFIMTTRDYILRQAQQSYEKLGDPIFGTARILVNAESLSLHEKCHILYNQLYFSPLRRAASAAPSGEYIRVVSHRNFNPRMTEAAIAALVREAGLKPRRRDPPVSEEREYRTNFLDPTEVPARLLEALEKPEELWDHVLRHQLDDLPRAVLLVRFSMGSASILTSELYAATRAFCEQEDRRCLEVDLDSAVSILEGDLLSLELSDRQRGSVGALNPGLADAVGAFLARYPGLMLSIIKSAVSYIQVRSLAGFFGYPFELPRTQPNPQRKEAGEAIVRNIERTLFSSSVTSTENVLFAISQPWYRQIGTRLEFLLNMYSVTRMRPRSGLFEQIADGIIQKFQHLDASDLIRVLQALRSDQVPQEWRPARTTFEVKILERLSRAEDVRDWGLLKSAMNIIPVTDHFVNDMTDRFEAFASELIAELVSQLEGDPQGDEEDIYEDISSMADRWSCSLDTSEIEELLERQREREESEADSSFPQPFLSMLKQTGGGSSATADPSRLFDLL
ncbi:restriction endonuclease [Micromonospora sp. NPDC047670]|uniref:nSTAND3 domain-containing NTPase n=1 Tax=Micromonospora sp. NPDC047670 TaxID=3364252 RepID=UPI00371D6D16